MLYFFPFKSQHPKIEEPKVEQLTVFVTDEHGNAVLEYKGELNIPLGNRILNRPIESKGRTNFADITANNIGDTITIGLIAEGWELVDKNNRYVFDTLKVKKDNSLGHIKGKVRTRDGQNFIDSAKITINSDTVIFSNDNGFFEIVLPENMRVKKVTERYELTVSKEGYQTLTQLHSTKSAQADIRLTKTK